ncbi:MAG TPA: biopolymer transporter ExbD [Kiritimatiellia bacterium]|jgi:biopolymer transport protein ExbD|nr:biopolymer transporter ExbD [Kiritimatiellia bacterium]OQC60260.1 MAG: biopolymer transport protein ExbD [Verrucomicrobia bacterium ADurb.Bin018]HOE00004.1 biopolymer transporter ExbD [Kiritimatiellia bacterium]HOE36886.1 biopolymer transporter ExbD [Kiritimatiellia bacterium]HOR74881.1 biopolymer transporter ExbD [Kiritimatiellia bacterium]
MRIPDQPIQLQFRSVRRRFKGRFRRAVGPIEVTALLNVMALVMMFMFLSSRFILQPGVRVELPTAPFTGGAPYGARVLTLAQGGLIFYNDEKMELADLGAALAKSSDEPADSALLVEADEGTPYGTLMQVYALAAEAGIQNVVLATRPPPVAP